jgi:carbamate kinase
LTHINANSTFPGSLGPKIAAAIEFTTMTQKLAFIGRMEDAGQLVIGKPST